MPETHGPAEDIIDNKTTDWIKVFLTLACAAIETKADIVLFPAEIQKRTYPTSLIDSIAFQEDVHRSNWHTHCPKMDNHRQEYIADLQRIIGEYHYNSMAKPSGPLGAVMHVQ
ncbi:hypothetical protein GGI35DRAFT_67149 [Trichoderma velutinum]